MRAAHTRMHARTHTQTQTDTHTQTHTQTHTDTDTYFTQACAHPLYYTLTNKILFLQTHLVSLSTLILVAFL